MAVPLRSYGLVYIGTNQYSEVPWNSYSKEQPRTHVIFSMSILSFLSPLPIVPLLKSTSLGYNLHTVTMHPFQWVLTNVYTRVTTNTIKIYDIFQNALQPLCSHLLVSPQAQAGLGFCHYRLVLEFIQMVCSIGISYKWNHTEHILFASGFFISSGCF